MSHICRCDFNGPIIKSIIKYSNHPSKFELGKVPNKTKKPSFSFSDIKRNKEKLLKIGHLNSSKASQHTDVPTKIIKINADNFTDFIHSDFNN